jgi:acyl-coenzyme A synthetase/AMP-(fatty) acid ligase
MAECEHGMVPIGYPGPQVEVLVLDESLTQVSPRQDGELVIGGPQVTPGYWENPERTSAAFIRLPGRPGIYYRTGDLVRSPAPGEPIVFLGRFDHQIKIGGVRIELGEVEKALRDVAEVPVAVALGWPRTASGASGIVGFITRTAYDDSMLISRLRERLPSVMVPKRVVVLDAFPLNANGKVDRKALHESLVSSASAQ